MPIERQGLIIGDGGTRLYQISYQVKFHMGWWHITWEPTFGEKIWEV